MRLLGVEVALKIGPKIKAIEEQGNKAIKCNLGETNFSVPVFTQQEAKRLADLDSTCNFDPQGALSPRQAVARQDHLRKPTDREIL